MTLVLRQKFKPSNRFERIVEHDNWAVTIENGVIERGYDVVPFTLEQIKAVLKEEVTDYRWKVETGGITLPSGLKVKTGLDDQNRISSVITNAHLVGLTEMDFKAENGWYHITLTQLEDIARAIALHLQECFSAEKENHEAIDDITDRDELINYDITQHFPTLGGEP